MAVTYTTSSAATYVPIATQTLGSATASVTFSSIPSTYTDLVIIANHAGVSGLNNLYVTLNSDTGSNYSYTLIAGDGTSATSARASTTAASFGNSSLTVGATTTIINLMNYANTAIYKTLLGRNGTANGSQPSTSTTVNLWRSTAAINSVLLSYYNVNFAAGSTFTLYGILGA